MRKFGSFAMKSAFAVAMAASIAVGAVYAGVLDGNTKSACTVSIDRSDAGMSACPLVAGLRAMNPLKASAVFASNEKDEDKNKGRCGGGTCSTKSVATAGPTPDPCSLYAMVPAMLAAKDKGEGKPDGCGGGTCGSKSVAATSDTCSILAMTPAMLATKDKGEGKPDGCGGGTCGTKSVAAAFSSSSAPVSAMLAAKDKGEGKPDGCGGGTCGTKSVAAACSSSTAPVAAMLASETCDKAAKCDKAATCEKAASCDKADTCDKAASCDKADTCEKAAKKNCVKSEKTDVLSAPTAEATNTPTQVALVN